MNFNIIDDPKFFYCKPANDYLPQPQSVMITGITPQIALKSGLDEVEFSRRIYHLFNQSNTCIVGYNNICFDDEITRNLFYRNFYDPYAWSWKHGNSRWDLLNVIRAFYALRPDGITWPKKDNGLPDFRLEQITQANSILHEYSHDALSDVYATIAIAKLLKNKQPKLYDFLFYYRNKNQIKTIVAIQQMKPLLHISSIFGGARSNISCVLPLAWHPNNHNILITCDLCGDLSPLLSLNAYSINKLLYKRRDELKDTEVVPLKLIHINKCPVIVPINALSSKDTKRIGIDMEYCLNNLTTLRKNPKIREKVIKIYLIKDPLKHYEDVDAQIYKGFFSKNDHNIMNIIRKTDPDNLSTLDVSLNDIRIAKLLFRYRARNFPNTLDITEKNLWLSHRYKILNPKRIKVYIAELEKLFIQYADKKEKIRQLEELLNYVYELISLE